MWKGVKAGIVGNTVDPSKYTSGAAEPPTFRPKDPVQAGIRKQESFLVDVWSAQWFFALMGLAVVGTLALLFNVPL